MKKAITVILCIVMIMSITFPAAAISTVNLKSIKLDKSIVTLNIGQTYNIKATLSPVNTTQKSLTFTSDNNSVATIDKNGKITGVSVGTAKIKVLTVNKKIFASCNVKVSKVAKKPVVIKYTNFSAGTDNADALNTMIQSFEAVNPDIKIESNPVGYGEVFTQLATQIAAGNAPDCYELNIENFLAFTLRDKPVELGPLFTQTGSNPNVYGKGVLDACSLNGKQYAIPLSYSTVVLVYNKNLFDKAGVAYPTAQWTWKDELEAAKKIRALGDDTWGMFQEIQFWEFYKTVQQNGGNLLSPDGKKFTINSPENINTLQYMVDRVRVHKVMPSEEERADRGALDIFKEGKLGMIRQGVWSFTDLAASVKDFKWDVQVEPGNTKKATHFFANVASISKNSKHQLEAFKFINAMGSDKQIANIRLLAKWEIPPVVDPEIVKAYLSKSPPENRKAVLDSMNYSVTPPKLEQFQQLTDIINPQLEAIRSNGKSSKEVLDALQAEVEKKIVIK